LFFNTEKLFEGTNIRTALSTVCANRNE